MPSSFTFCRWVGTLRYRDAKWLALVTCHCQGSYDLPRLHSLNVFLLSQEMVTLVPDAQDYPIGWFSGVGFF